MPEAIVNGESVTPVTMEEVVSRLSAALLKVVSNKGASGSDLGKGYSYAFDFDAKYGIVFRSATYDQHGCVGENVAVAATFGEELQGTLFDPGFCTVNARRPVRRNRRKSVGQ